MGKKGILKAGVVLGGQYEILKEIGEGGMSYVYLARDNHLNKQWAVKEIKNDGSKSTETLLKSLEREANILKDVDHPVIPRIVDIVKYSGTICVIMDFIEGENLGDRLKQVGALDQEQVIEWSLELASALDYLHNRKPPIIYRDMKPSNVMIKPDDAGVKLIDFGTAKEYTIENNADTTALGTRGYAAPEQFGDSQGRGIYKTDARTDIYNLGATMYHMVTGRNPQEPPYEMVPIRQVNPALSTGLERIILKCTRPNPNDRYQNCSELIYALEHYTELDDSYRKSNRNKVILFGASVLLTIVFGTLAIVGKSGITRLNNNTYASHIDEGNSYKITKEYDKAEAEYEEAYGLLSDKPEAYLQLINLYVDKFRTSTADDPKQELNDNLAKIAAKIKNSGAKKDPELMFNLGKAYYVDAASYDLAAQYFGEVKKMDDDTYSTLAGYYYSIAAAKAGTASDADKAQLASDINSFADYNMSHFDVTDEQRYINYNILGQYYLTNLNEENVEKAETVLTQAENDLGSYNGENLSDYDCSFSDYLAQIYKYEGKTESAKTYCQKVINYMQSSIGGDFTGSSGNSKNYISNYVNKVCMMAELYAAEDDVDSALKTYREAEEYLGVNGYNVSKVYTEHLDYLYNLYSAKNQNVTKWSKTEKDTILAVYNAGSKVEGIDKGTWTQRKSDMEAIKSSGEGK